MYIITDKENNVLVNHGESVSYWDNGYPTFDGILAYPTIVFNLCEVDTIPEGVEANKYCYTAEQGFYLNPDWIEPDPTNTYGISDEIYHAIINDITTEVANSGY